MKTVAMVTATVALAWSWAVLCRHAWLQHTRRLADARIARNRAKRRPGMDKMDEPLRDRTTARRRRDEQAIENFARELRNGNVRFRRVS